MRTDNHAEIQAVAHWGTIADLESAASADWDRLEELRDMEPQDLTPSDQEEIEALTAQVSEYTSREDAEERIQEYPLSVEVRSDWCSPGEELTPGEFCILLCTGGPAVRIMGELDEHREPCRAWIEYQDWGTPWTQYFGADQGTLVDFCRRFYFGA